MAMIQKPKSDMTGGRKIAALSLSYHKPLLIRAGYSPEKGLLSVVERKEFSQDIRNLKNELPDLLQNYAANGYVVVVDETIPIFARYGRPLKLEMVGADNRPVIVSALEAYNAMTDYSILHFKKGVTPIDIPASIVDEDRDDSGKLAYRIDWEQVTADNAALLLTIYAAVNDSLYDPETTKELFKLLGGQKKKHNSTAGIKSALQSLDIAATKRVTHEKG